MILQLDFFKKWYLLCHVVYMICLVVLGTVFFFLTQPDLSLVDALFIAMSTVCNCGLQTVNVGSWHPIPVFFRHVLMVFGGVVFTSAYQPLLRLVMLRRVRSVFIPREDDSPQEKILRDTKRQHAQRLYYTSVICTATSLAYFVTVNCTIGILLLTFNCSQLSVMEVFYMTVSSFHSCVFLSMEQYVSDAAVVVLITIACALGFTAYPVVLRGFFHMEWWMHRCVFTLFIAAPPPDGEDPEEHVPILTTSEPDGSPLDSAAQLEDDPWHRGFSNILSSPTPGTFHPFLFLADESAYLGCAWWALTIMQAVPFYVQHWDGLLLGFSAAYKILLATCQASVIRFAAASFVPLHQYSSAHIAVTILAMYIPALPISTDRSYRKWKAMMTTSIVRLLTSRLFWLFLALVAILFAIESSVSNELIGTQFDVMTRTLFEVISAYAGCGLSLSVPGTSVSFTASAGTFSKLVIAAVLFGGRHRFVDLGIDLGFGAVQSNLAITPREP